MGSPKGGTWDNGWTEWFLSWLQFVQGSALHEAVEAGRAAARSSTPPPCPPRGPPRPLQTAPANNAGRGLTPGLPGARRAGGRRRAARGRRQMMRRCTFSVLAGPGSASAISGPGIDGSMTPSSSHR